MSTDAYVSVVLPCLNEEGTVGACVTDALLALEALSIRFEIIVVDNGSIDASIRRAINAGAYVVDCPLKGYGAALRHGIEHSSGGLIVMADADGTYDLCLIEQFIRPLQRGADMVLGNRFAGGIMPGAMPWKNRYVGNPLLTGLLNVLYGVKIGDAHCGLRSFTREAYERIKPSSPGMEFASELIVRAITLRLSIEEVPVKLRPNPSGRKPHLRPWRDGWRHMRYLIGQRFTAARVQSNG